MFKNTYNSLKAIFTGLFTVFAHLFKKPVTEEYPEVKPELNENFRGRHILTICGGCGYCQKVCPSDAITIIKKDGHLDKYIIDFGKCIFCGNCMYHCPVKAMKMTDDFELACSDKSNLLVVIENKSR